MATGKTDNKHVVPGTEGQNPVIVEVSTYGGRTSVDIRHYWTPEGSDEAVPTKKGVHLPIELLSDLVSILEGLDAS